MNAFISYGVESQASFSTYEKGADRFSLFVDYNEGASDSQ